MTAPCVPALRQKVGAWREGGYPGATETTRTLLNWWFATDHRLADGSPSLPRLAARCDRDADLPLRGGEGSHAHKACWRPTRGPDIRLPAVRRFARYCIKMATGSGKTKVMALAIAWQYFNAVAEGARRLRAHLPDHRPQRDRLRAAADRLRRRAHLPGRPGHPAGAADLLGLRLLHARRGERASSRARCTSPTSSSSTSAPDRPTTSPTR